MASSKGPTEQQIVAEFKNKQGRLQSIAGKLQELRLEVTQHEMVIKTLQPMDAGRKCFRLVGDVLVERTVGEALPAVTKNKENLETVIRTLEESFETLEKNITEFKALHGIRILDGNGRPIDVPPEQEAGSSSKAPAKSQGVLVK